VAKITESEDIFNIKGIIIDSEPMWRHTTFMVGGPAQFYAVPAGEEDLRHLFTAAAGTGLEVFILGGGSNILVADSGIRGLVIDTRLFNEYRIENAGQILVLGAGLNVSDAAWRSGSSGYRGLDFLFGMPGSVGGALWMNARCYGEEIAGCVEWIEVMDRSGAVARLSFRKDEWGYKHSPFQTEEGRKLILLRAGFRITPGDSEEIKAEMREKRNDRAKKGHFNAPCAGSAFKNNRDFGAPSGVLIERCNLKGRENGAAAVAPWHANIIINRGSAKASEIRNLLEEVAGKVKESTGFQLEMEVLMVGDW